MKILWFSANSASDLCFTSQHELASGLMNNGYEVQFINKDTADLHSEFGWQHVPIKSSSIAGLQSSSLAKGMANWLRQQTLDQATIAVVDWRLITKLYSSLTHAGIPWILLDRSPPADTGILSKFQWPIWRKAWRLVANSNQASGTVVSAQHQRYVIDSLKVPSEKFTILPAGVDLSKFSPRKESSRLALVYHGRLDKHRGILALPMLVRKCISSGLDVSLKLIGDGDCFDELQAIAQDMPSISVHSKISTTEVAKYLQESTIGILPMPEIDVWTISSPLKLSEYCACGLLIFGIDHQGHKLGNSDTPWIKLVPQHDFHDEGMKWLAELTTTDIEALSISARKFAEVNLGWEHSVNSLVRLAQSIIES